MPGHSTRTAICALLKLVEELHAENQALRKEVAELRHAAALQALAQRAQEQPDPRPRSSDWHG